MLDLTTYLPKLKGLRGQYRLHVSRQRDPSKGYRGSRGDVAQCGGGAETCVCPATGPGRMKPPVLPGTATADEIKADFDNVAKQAGGKIASYYQQFTKLDLPQSVIDSTVNDEIFHFKVGLIASFPDFESYHRQRSAPRYSIWLTISGMDGLTSKFPTFCKAVKAKDWATAAKECHRTGPPDDRNDWTKAQFDKVAADVARSGGKSHTQFLAKPGN